jgi:hypothetical protein
MAGEKLADQEAGMTGRQESAISVTLDGAGTGEEHLRICRRRPWRMGMADGCHRYI